jgi:UDP-3-O-[3-hydroxymyristoyl] glucosamine N-acyltransferase
LIPGRANKIGNNPAFQERISVSANGWIERYIKIESSYIIRANLKIKKNSNVL